VILDERTQVQAVTDPCILLVVGEVQGHHLAPDDFANPVELVGIGKRVHLEELRHVIPEDLERLHDHRAQVHRLDGNGRALGGGDDHSGAGKAHLGSWSWKATFCATRCVRLDESALCTPGSTVTVSDCFHGDCA